jgi:hypothetical protein
VDPSLSPEELKARYGKGLVQVCAAGCGEGSDKLHVSGTKQGLCSHCI